MSIQGASVDDVTSFTAMCCFIAGSLDVVTQRPAVFHLSLYREARNARLSFIENPDSWQCGVPVGAQLHHRVVEATKGDFAAAGLFLRVFAGAYNVVSDISSRVCAGVPLDREESDFLREVHDKCMLPIQRSIVRHMFLGADPSPNASTSTSGEASFATIGWLVRSAIAGGTPPKRVVDAHSPLHKYVPHVAFHDFASHKTVRAMSLDDLVQFAHEIRESVVCLLGVADRFEALAASASASAREDAHPQASGDGGVRKRPPGVDVTASTPAPSALKHHRSSEFVSPPSASSGQPPTAM